MGLELKVKGSSINASELKEGEVAVVTHCSDSYFAKGRLIQKITIEQESGVQTQNISTNIYSTWIITIGYSYKAISPLRYREGELMVRVLQKGDEILIK
ncbi:hypothetical protein M1M25_gp101 [Tenacibaculum phage Gundel_1]|uniref:Uncharacterized protein n=1 Tax=Tenacibaculum phage Gundel_1 TaxID=2745672 RepID=A0A8E4ZFX7_9CAUD|nr:hypothetical protein M1M25_gp101 [Tenacibaculum phage Gundel_1]QQV91440.1 hypothetical protein Gundel1_117 [Tenacibaculum phage Gundel_1]